MALSCHALHILTSAATPLLGRTWKAGVPIDYINNFTLAFKADHDRLPPILTVFHFEYFHVLHSDLIFLCVAQKGTNPALVFKFIDSVVSLLKEYFGQLTEESIRDNFVLIYELLDEVMDNGYPQFTEGAILKKFITLGAHRLDPSKPPGAVTSAVSWRNRGIVYAKNEVFLDVVERCTISVNGFGEVAQSALHGSVQMNAQLSGMPECKLGLNEAFASRHLKLLGEESTSRIDDVTFHHCVNLAATNEDRSITFIPPDGHFELASYRLSSGVAPLIWIDSTRKSLGSTRLQYKIKLSTLFKERFSAQEIKVIIPVESDATNPEVQCKVGQVTYCPEESCISWTLKNISGKREVDLQMLLSVPSVKGNTDEASSLGEYIHVHFEIPYLTPSGLQVRYLKVFEKSGYASLPWVRYVTKSGQYTFKIT